MVFLYESDRANRVSSMSTFTSSAGFFNTAVPCIGGDLSIVTTPELSQKDQRFTDWRIRSGTLPPTYLAWDQLRQSDVEIRFLPWLQTNSTWEDACAVQCDRIVKLRYPIAVPVVEFGRSEGVPRIVLESQSCQRLSDFLNNADRESFLEVALHILWTIHTACTQGLYHGALKAEGIKVVSCDPVRIQCDFTDRFLHERNSVLPNAAELYESDLRDAILLVQQIVLQASESEDEDSKIPARPWAALKRLAREEINTAELESSFDTWCKTLGECVQDSKNPFRTEWVAPIDRTLAVSVRDEAPSKHPDSSLSQAEVAEKSDSTCEVAIALQQPIPGTRDEETDEKTFISAVDHPVSGTTTIQRMLRPGEMLGDYLLERLLGQGGMGMVFQAKETRSGRTVAIKVLLNQHGDNPHAIRRFTKEARILASVRNEYVTELIEVGQANGFHFLAMEFVDGPTLKTWLRDRKPVAERESLQFIADLCKALSQAHAQQIVHRDIKPDNILLASRSHSVDPATRSMDGWQIKLSDFGIARHIQQSASMEVTRAGTMLGTPMYMAPEQCKGQSEISPATDIYAVGILLFEMLTGDVPFRSDDPMKTAAMQCFDPVPDLQKQNREISDRTCQLVTRMLAKNPRERFADATQLLLEINRLLSGEPSELEDHPRLPEHDSKKLWVRTFEWTLQSKARDLWPLVSDTDRLNRAVGLPAVKYRTEKDPIRGLRKFGSFQLGALQVAWEEHPFEWIEGKRMGVLREFSSGPFKWFMSSVELFPLSSGGTRLVHTVKIEPRNTLGKIVSTIEAGWKGGRALDRVYKHIDEYLQSQTNSESAEDPFEEAPVLSRARLKRLEERTEQMRRLGIDLDLCRMLSDYIRFATPQAASKIRPICLAKTLGVDPDKMVDACIVAASVGMLQLHWDILCPSCKAPASSEPLLSRISNHTNCEACDSDFQSNLANTIEMVFSVHPELRDVDSGKYCIGGPGNSPHVIGQVRLQPGERIELDLPMQTGHYLLRSTQSIESQSIVVRSSHAPSQLEFSISKLGKGGAIPNLREGMVSVIIQNDLDKQQLIRIERTIGRDDIVTAAAASAMARFRKLFPDQVFQSDVPVTSEDLTLVAIQINNVESLYDRLGDTVAYRKALHFLSAVETLVSQYRGAIVKTVSEGVLASFQDCASAVRLAIRLQAEVENGEQLESLKVGIAIHRGRLLISSQNGRLDYFGSNARLVMQLASSHQSGVTMTESIFSDPMVQHLLRDSAIETTLCERKVSGDRTILLQEWSPDKSKTTLQSSIASGT